MLLQRPISRRSLTSADTSAVARVTAMRRVLSPLRDMPVGCSIAVSWLLAHGWIRAVAVHLYCFQAHPTPSWTMDIRRRCSIFVFRRRAESDFL
jgi:hypothetical protein